MNGFTTSTLVFMAIVGLLSSAFAANNSNKSFDEKIKYDAQMGCMGCHQGAINQPHDNKKAKSK